MIQDFLEHVKHFLFSIVKNHINPRLMLVKANGYGYLPKKGIFDNCVNVAHHYIGLYGAKWKNYVHSIG